MIDELYVRLKSVAESKSNVASDDDMDVDIDNVEDDGLEDDDDAILNEDDEVVTGKIKVSEIKVG